jgi:hypothetical protein
MSNEQWITAEELLQKLENDPVYQQKMAEKRQRREARQARYDADAERLTADLLAVGCAENLDQMVNSPKRLAAPIVGVLLDHLNKCTESANREFIVRALGGAEVPFDGTALTQCFAETRDSEGVRWAILNTISIVQPTGIDDWLRQLIKNDYWKGQLQKLGYPMNRIR